MKQVKTNFRDMNGRMLYEGDLVKQNLPDSVCLRGYFPCRQQVVFKKGCWLLYELDFDYSNTPLNEMIFLSEEVNHIKYYGNQNDISISVKPKKS